MWEEMKCIFHLFDSTELKVVIPCPVLFSMCIVRTIFKYFCTWDNSSTECNSTVNAGTFASASNIVTPLERESSQASVGTPDSALPPLPNGGSPSGSMLSPPLPVASAGEDLNIDELAKEIDAIGQGLSFTLPTSGEDVLPSVISESSTLQALDITEYSGPLGLDQSELPVISTTGDDFGGFVLHPAMSVAQDLQIGTPAVPVGAVPERRISNGSLVDDLESESVCTNEVESKTSVKCIEHSNVEEEFVTRTNDPKTTLQPPENEFGEFESTQGPPEGDLHPTQFLHEDLGSSRHPPQEEFGDFGSSRHLPEEEFGDFGSFSRHPHEQEFGEFGSSMCQPEEDEFGNFGSAAPSQVDDFGDFSAAPSTVQEDFGSFSSVPTSANSTSTSVPAPKPSTSLPVKEVRIGST